MTQAGERPCAGFCKGRRPFPLDVADANFLVEKPLALEGGQHSPADCLVRATVAGAQVDGPQTISLFVVGEHNEAVVRPNGVLGGVPASFA